VQIVQLQQRKEHYISDIILYPKFEEFVDSIFESLRAWEHDATSRQL
jgi:hypothetical protein